MTEVETCQLLQSSRLDTNISDHALYETRDANIRPFIVVSVDNNIRRCIGMGIETNILG